MDRETRQIIATEAVTEFLATHRHEPPENDGWQGPSDIYFGIRHTQGKKVRLRLILDALESLQNMNPPAVEETWMLETSFHEPILVEQFAQPNQPKGARRYYRWVGVLATELPEL